MIKMRSLSPRSGSHLPSGIQRLPGDHPLLPFPWAILHRCKLLALSAPNRKRYRGSARLPESSTLTTHVLPHQRPLGSHTRSRPPTLFGQCCALCSVNVTREQVITQLDGLLSPGTFWSFFIAQSCDPLPLQAPSLLPKYPTRRCPWHLLTSQPPALFGVPFEGAPPNPCSPLTPSALPTCPYPAPHIHPAPVCKGAPGHVHSPDVSCEPQANVSIYLLHAPKWMSHKYPKGDMSRMDSSNSLPTFP